MKSLNKLTVIAILTALVVLAVPAMAINISGLRSGSMAIDYYDQCPHDMSDSAAPERAKDPELMLRTNQCLAYTGGLLDGLILHDVATEMETGKPVFGSEIHDISPYQFALILIGYMQKHPEKLNLSTRMLALYALHDAYPPPAPKGTNPAIKEY